MAVRHGSATPILRIFDVVKAREFYTGYLGNAVDWEHRFEPALPLYMQISRGGSTLHLSELHGDGTPGQRVRVAAEDVGSYHAELHAKDYGYMRPELRTAPWGERSITVIDPFGNTSRFGNRPNRRNIAGIRYGLRASSPASMRSSAPSSSM